jgi:hypothetical protein
MLFPRRAGWQTTRDSFLTRKSFVNDESLRNKVRSELMIKLLNGYSEGDATRGLMEFDVLADKFVVLAWTT